MRPLIIRIVCLLSLPLLGLSACGGRSDEAVLREPDTASRLNVAEAALSSGQTDIALSMFAAAAAAAPDNVRAQSSYAGLLIQVGKPELADQVLSRALLHHSDEPLLLHQRGILQIETGAAPEALMSFDRLLRLNPNDVSSINGRGIALDLLDRHTEAQQAYRSALILAPNDVQTTNNLAVSYLLSDRPMDAAQLLTPLAERPDAPGRVVNNLAIAQAATGNRAAAAALVAGKPGAADLSSLAEAFSVPAAQTTPPEPVRSESTKPTG